MATFPIISLFHPKSILTVYCRKIVEKSSQTNKTNRLDSVQFFYANIMSKKLSTTFSRNTYIKNCTTDCSSATSQWAFFYQIDRANCWFTDKRETYSLLLAAHKRFIFQIYTMYKFNTYAFDALLYNINDIWYMVYELSSSWVNIFFRDYYPEGIFTE